MKYHASAPALWDSSRVTRTKRVRRISIGAGTLLQVVAVLVGLALAVLAGVTRNLPLSLFMSLLSWGALWMFSHCLAHYLAGRAFGISFEYYFIGRSDIRKLRLPLIASLASFMPALGIKTNEESMRAASSSAKARMFRAGAIASMSLPFFVPVVQFLFEQRVVGSIMMALSLANLGFTLYFSPRAGDFKKASGVIRQGLAVR